MMKLAICSECLSALPFHEQCQYAAEMGYDGLEIAPYTLSDDPRSISDRELNSYMKSVTAAGITVTSLHWLLLAPEGLSIVDRTPSVRARTLDTLYALIDMCAALGGQVLVHGSPRQRSLGEQPEQDRAAAVEYFRIAAERAAQRGVTYCVEPLAREETNFINTVAEAADLIREINLPGLRTMIDTSAAARTEVNSVAATLDEWLPTGLIAHVQLNDRNRRGPGQGEDGFRPVLDVLRAQDYTGTAAIEPFVYKPDAISTAAWCAGYIRGLQEEQS